MASSIKAAINWIKSIASDPEVGHIYEGTVVKVMDFGAFVNFFGAKDGLVHISQLAPRRVNKVTDVVKEGDKVKVKLLGMDERGKVRLSMKAVDQATGEDIEGKQRPEGGEQPQAGPRRRRVSRKHQRIAKGRHSEPPFSTCLRAGACHARGAKRFVTISAKRREILASRRGAPPSETDRTRGLRFGKAQQFHAVVAQLRFRRQPLAERDAITVGHHLHHGRERSGAESSRPAYRASGRTKCSAWSRRQCPSSSRISRR